MPLDQPFDARGPSDRRRRPTSPWGAFRHKGRRAYPRREEERRLPYFVDRIDPTMFVLAVLLLILTIVDGTITLLLLGANCEEINPAMGYLLRRGPLHFLLGKYILTTAGLPFLLIFQNFTLFRTRFRVGYLIPVFVALYLILLGYQIALMNTPSNPPEHDFEDNVQLISYVEKKDSLAEDSGLSRVRRET
jgi:Domain of unknown function (DUF5658)